MTKFKQYLPLSFEDLANDEEDLERFELKVDSFKSQGKKGPDAHGFLAFLTSEEMVTKYINQLRFKSTKKKPLSFERLNLIVFPIFKYFES